MNIFRPTTLNMRIQREIEQAKRQALVPPHLMRLARCKYFPSDVGTPIGSSLAVYQRYCLLLMLASFRHIAHVRVIAEKPRVSAFKGTELVVIAKGYYSRIQLGQLSIIDPEILEECINVKLLKFSSNEDEVRFRLKNFKSLTFESLFTLKRSRD